MMRSVSLVLFVLTMVPCRTFAQDLESEVTQLLRFAKMEAVVGSMAEDFGAEVTPLVGALSEEEKSRLETAVAEEFSVQRLKEDVVVSLTEAGDAEIVRELLRWLPTGATAGMDRLREGHEPEESLEEFARGLQSNPPDQARLMLVAEWVRVQGAADFYVLLGQAERYAAYTIARALRNDLEPFDRPSEALLAEQRRGAFNASIVSFLQALAPVPDDLIRQAIDEYSSPSGQWFVQHYTSGLADAIEKAGERVAARWAKEMILHP